MKVKDMQEFLNNFDENQQFVIRGGSGIEWRLDEESLSTAILLKDKNKNVTVRIK